MELAWCGADAVALRWEGLLLLAGPYGDWLRLPSPGPAAMAQEVDGLRVVTEASHTLIRRVAAPLLDCYRPGSTAPSAALLDARDLYDGGAPRCDSALRELKAQGALEGAVAACVEAAGETGGGVWVRVGASGWIGVVGSEAMGGRCMVD